MSSKRRWTGFFMLFILATLAACGGGGSSTPGQTAAVITSQPTDQSVVEGTTATFNVVAANATGYQWQTSSDGGTTFDNVIGATAASYTTAVTTLADSDTRYRVVVSGASNSVTSSAVTLTVTAAPVAPAISVHPAAQIVTEGQNASFSVTATGTTLGYQWQRSTDGGTSFADIAGATNATLTLTAAPLADNAHQFRVVVSNSAGSVTSNTALLTVNAAQSAPVFTTQPASVSIVEGQNTQFEVAVSGTPAPTLQWQLSTDSGSSWNDIVGQTNTIFTVTAPNSANNGRQFRAVASNSAGTVNSNAATLTVTVSTGFPAGAAAYRANDGVNGSELWITDGTSAGTVMVKDINPGAGNSLPQYMTRFGAMVLFMADDGVHGNELWRSDGTAAGTFMVSDLRTGSLGSFPSKFTLCNGSLFFGAVDGLGGALWKTDGTAEGTARLAPITVMNTSRPMVCVNNLLILSAINDAQGAELWRSDGTVVGTALVRDIIPGVDSSDPRELVEFLGHAYFSAAQGLWRSDGTTAGTTLVADALGEPRWLTVNGTTLYFSAATAAFGSEPWKSDGTPAGTQLLKDLNTEASLFGTRSSFPYKFTVSGGVTYFAAEPVSNSQQLWRTDGTAAGTFIVKQINPGRVATFGDSIFDFAGTLYFLAAEGTTTNQELWKSDGTDAGTVLVKDINPGTSGSLPNGFTTVGGALLFSAHTLGSATELWRTDGSEAGTQMVKDICPGSCYGDPQPR